MHAALPGRVLTLDQALRKLAREAAAFRLDKANIAKWITLHGNALCRFFKSSA